MTTPNTVQNVALVTGGSTGIGWEICRQMLDAGYEVVSLARRRPPQSHAKLHAVEVDLMDAAATGQAAADVAARFAVTHVVHNAGVVRPALLPDVELDDLKALSSEWDALTAAGGIAGNTVNIPALGATIGVATEILQAAGTINDKAGTIADVLAARAQGR